ncbi:MAG: hypothetical protein M0R22_09720, partial [Dehalococcoidia bacterium]|nr:hypothetical protein [Dehalococcoidia bacterium]
MSMVRPVEGTRRKWVSPCDNPLIIVRRALALARREGITGVFSGAGRFVGSAFHHLYSDSLLRVYHLPVAEATTIPATKPPDNLHVHIIESQQDALRLAEEGFDNILEAVPGAEHKLRCGAVAACAFLGRELASIDWMALSDRAKLVLDSVPYPADFEASDACSGGAFTMPHLRGKGIAAYRFSAQVSYLHSKGRRTCYNAIAVDNIPSQLTVER